MIHNTQLNSKIFSSINAIQRPKLHFSQFAPEIGTEQMSKVFSSEQSFIFRNSHQKLVRNKWSKFFLVNKASFFAIRTRNWYGMNEKSKRMKKRGISSNFPPQKACRRSAWLEKCVWWVCGVLHVFETKSREEIIFELETLGTLCEVSAISKWHHWLQAPLWRLDLHLILKTVDEQVSHDFLAFLCTPSEHPWLYVSYFFHTFSDLSKNAFESLL